MKKLNINIDGKELEAFAGQTILDAAKENGIFIPTLCADGRTEIYGACGLCVVEAEGNPKLLKACATELTDGMIVKTHTPRVMASRKTTLELLLSDHTGDCRPPCVHACPAHTDCQGYVGLVANGQGEEAYRLIMDCIPIPASIGRICPHPCEDECRRGLVEESVGIAMIKRFCGDLALEADAVGAWMPEVPRETGKCVSIIGGGPYGLSLAFFLRQYGHSVTIYEAMPKAGGMLRYGIPEYRLPKAVLDAEIARIEAMGVKIKTGVRIGRDIPFETLRSDSDAVCIGIGAWVSTGTGAKGEDLPGVIGGIELLSRIAAGEDVFLGRRVAVVGGGNTAMDACRTAIRMGAAEVYNVYRRTKNEMPAEQIEIEEAGEEGVIFKELTNPIEIIPGADGAVAKIKLQIMQLGEPDESGRRAPVPVKGKTETIAVDTVVLAVGQAVDPASLNAPDLGLTRKKGVAYDPETFMTSVPGVFAGGDCGNDKVSIAVEAIADAKHSAGIIDAYIFGENVCYRYDYSVKRTDITERTFEERERLFRPPVDCLTPGERRRSFAEVASGWDGEASGLEALRCLECGCGDYFECKLIDYARRYDVKPERFEGDLAAAEKDGTLPPPDADRDGHRFVEREEGKCILCGLCVRVCDEIAGVAALGFAGRGFDTVVTPAFGVPLAESGCLSCGLCVDACPTGAMRERLSIKKSVPLETKVTYTVCPHCGIGCTLALETNGSLLLKANPVTDDGEKGLICGRGKFGFDCSETEGSETGARLTEPLARGAGAGELLPVTWSDAFVAIAKKAQSIRATCGPGSVAVSISDRLTNEEMYAARSMALSLGARVLSFNNRASVAAQAYGTPASASFEELLHTDYILAVGIDFKASPVLGMKLHQAAAAGVRIVRIETDGGKDPSFGARIEGETIISANNLKLLCGVEAELRNQDGKASAKAALIAGQLKKAKKAMFVYQRNVLTPEAAELLLRIAHLSGHAGAPRDGLFEIQPKCNSRGLYDLGIRATAQDILESGFGADVKALIVIGEDPRGQIAAAEAMGTLPEELKAAKKLLAQTDFLAVCDTHMTATAEKADLVIPLSGFASSEGTYTNTEGRMLAVSRAAESSAPYGNWRICHEIARAAGSTATWKSELDISLEMCGAEPFYRNTPFLGTQARPDAKALREAFAALASDEKEYGGKLVSPLPTSDNLTRVANRRLGTEVYGD